MTEIDDKMRGDIVLTAQWEKRAKPAYVMSKDGKTVTFGSYPQTLVTDEALSAKLTENVGSMSIISDDGWTSFGFYSENTVRNCAWYKDIESLSRYLFHRISYEKNRYGKLRNGRTIRFVHAPIRLIFLTRSTPC